MGLKGQGGLSDLLNSTAEINEMVGKLVRPSGLPGLDLLPCGPRRPNPSELLSSPRMADLLAWAETVYDQILVDSPPALVASDTSIVGRLVDGAMLVVQPKKNRRRLVMRAAEALSSVDIKLLGVVVNRIGSEAGDEVYGYGADYGYGYGYGYGNNIDSTSEALTAEIAESEAASVSPESHADQSEGLRVVRRRVA
jgi:Mrp family chromosome partitioning ATPase